LEIGENKYECLFLFKFIDSLDSIPA
jgi:hypothetical protein